MFAKLYETKLGQILVKLDAGDETEAEVRFYTEPEGLGVCSLALGFNDWDKAEEAFKNVDEARALQVAEQLWQYAPTGEEAED